MLFGRTSIVVCNVLVAVVLIGVRAASDDASNRVCLLGLSNLLLSATLLIPGQATGNRARTGLRDTLPLFAWAVAYCLIYGSFLLLPRLFNLSHVIIANSTAPMVAVFASGDWTRARERLLTTLLRASPLCLLMLVAMMEWKSLDQSYSAIVRWAALVALIFFAVVSQSMARIVARDHSPTWAPPRLAAYNGILLVGASLMMGNTLVTQPIWKWTVLPLVFAAGIFVLQMLYLHGLKVTHPTLAALLISTSVPIAIAVEYIWAGTARSSWSAILAILYCVYIGILNVAFSNSCCWASMSPALGSPREAKTSDLVRWR
jgi:drug/metabolite transporter (DMT)-like permease